MIPTSRFMSSCIPLPGAQGSADGNASAEHSGRAVQPAALPGARPVSLRDRVSQGVRRPQDGGAGVEEFALLAVFFSLAISTCL